MTNNDYLLINPLDLDDEKNKPNYATTLQEQFINYRHDIDYKTPFLNEDQDRN